MESDDGVAHQTECFREELILLLQRHTFSFVVFYYTYHPVSLINTLYTFTSNALVCLYGKLIGIVHTDKPRRPQHFHFDPAHVTKMSECKRAGVLLPVIAIKP